MEIVWLALFGVVVVSYLYFQKEKRTVANCFRILALERNGRVRRSFWGFPQVRFGDLGKEVLVSVQPSSIGSGEATRSFALRYDSEYPEHFHFRLLNRSTQTVFESMLGYRLIRIDEPVTQQTLAVHCKDANAISSLLTPDVLQNIVALRPGHTIEISLQNAPFHDGQHWIECPRLSVSVGTVLARPEEFEILYTTLTDLDERIRHLSDG